MSTCNYTVSVVSSVLFIVLGCAIQLKYFHKARYSNAQFQGHREHLLKTDGTRPRNTVRPLNGETPCTGPVYSCSGRCPALRGLSPLWLLGLRPLGAWSWGLLLPLRVGGASLRRASVFSCPALVRVLGLAFSVAGGRCCPALHFSVACPWTRTMLCLTRKKKCLGHSI